MYPGQGTYVERLIYDVLIIKPISFAVGEIRAALMYLQLKLKMENNRYVEGEFTLPTPLKGKHTMENIAASKPIEPIEVEDEEDKHEDSGGFERRCRIHPTNKSEVECATTPP